MAKERRIPVEKVLPLLNKNALYVTSWGASRIKGEYKDKILKKLENILNLLKAYVSQAGLKGIVYYDIFSVKTKNNSLIFNDYPVKWDFPRNKNGRCIADAAQGTGTIALQAVTMGRKIVEIFESFEQQEMFSMEYYFHGFSVWLAEALAEYHHSLIHDELRTSKKMERYSFGYPLCPELSMQVDLFSLLNLNNCDEIKLNDSYMMIPEQSTSAIIFH